MKADRIEKSVLLRAPVRRVWRALTDSAEFGSWFGLRVNGAFEPGRRLRAVVTPTTADPEVAEAQKAYEGIEFEIRVERVEPERVFSFRWTHPEAPGADISAAPATLVEFTLEERAEGTLLTVIESGFEQIPLERRAAMFAENEQGWSIQARLIEAHLARNA